MAYMVIATFCFVFLGYSQIWDAINFSWDVEWKHNVPSAVYLLIYILCVVICVAVTIMCAWHLWSVMAGETSVEGHDFVMYRKFAKEREDTFVNCYDLGKRKNLELFFNIGPNGYPIYTLLLPLRVPPYTDGRAWARRDGFERHLGVREGEELTDEEEDDV